MTIVQIQCFCEVAKCGSFSQAADTLFMSQSSVSKHVSAFERECGFPLLFRGGKRFELTPEGQQMLRDCNWLLTAYDQLLLLRNTLRRKPHASAASFSLVGNPDMASYGIITSINQFNALHPGTTIQLQENEDAFCRLALTNNECDIAFTSDIRLDSMLYCWQDYCTETLSAVVSLDSPLAGKEHLLVKHLEGHPIITAPHKTSLFDYCLNVCKASGFEPQIALQTSRHSVALGYLESHPEMVYLSSSHSLDRLVLNAHRLIPIADAPAFHYVIAWKRDKILNAEMKRYLEFVSAPASDRLIAEYLAKHPQSAG